MKRCLKESIHLPLSILTLYKGEKTTRIMVGGGMSCKSTRPQIDSAKLRI